VLCVVVKVCSHAFEFPLNSVGVVLGRLFYHSLTVSGCWQDSAVTAFGGSYVDSFFVRGQRLSIVCGGLLFLLRLFFH